MFIVVCGDGCVFETNLEILLDLIQFCVDALSEFVGGCAFQQLVSDPHRRVTESSVDLA